MTEPDLQVLDLPAARVIALGGEIDILTAPHVAAQLPALLAGASAVVLDLTAVTFFDSSGVRLVDQVARACVDRAQPWRIVVPAGSSSRRLLEIVGMAGPQVLSDQEAALAELSR